jgi:DNA-binding LacI/PurR family transcriptional regulator
MKKQERAKPPTIRDVARLAGVSHTTVSFVINNAKSQTISSETRTRVLAAIKELDYHPSEAARSLNRRTSLLIGMAMPEAHNAHYLEIAAGVESYTEEHQYSVFQVNTHFDIERERACFSLLKQQRFDGLIIIPSTGQKLYHEMQQAFDQGYPVVSLGIYDARIDNVRAETETGERQILEHLISLGHHRIGYIHGVIDHTVLDYRLETCLRLQREMHIPVVDHWIKRCGPTVEDGYQAAIELITRYHDDQRPTALIVVNDLLATAVIAALHASGIAIPREMSVAAFDNTQIALHTVVPPLTSIDYSAHEMGMRAAQLILDRISDYERPRARLEMRARLMIRGSTGPAS